MEATAATGKVAAFKVYTAWGPNGQGYALDDPAIGLPVIQKAHDLGVKIIVAHKGLPLVDFDVAHNGPDDMVAVSRSLPRHAVRRVPRATGTRTTPKARTTPARRVGIDPLLAALDAHHVPPELQRVGRRRVGVARAAAPTRPGRAHARASCCRASARTACCGAPTRSGTDRRSRRSWRSARSRSATEFQERFGYPALTDAVKRKVFGLNAAQLFDLDPEATRCALRERPARRGPRRGRAAPPRDGVAALRVAAERPDDPARDAAVAGVAGDPLDAVVTGRRRPRPEHTFRAHGPTRR